MPGHTSHSGASGDDSRCARLVRFHPTEFRRLGDLSRFLGLSRSGLIRHAVRRYLERLERDAVRRSARASGRAPSGGAPERAGLPCCPHDDREWRRGEGVPPWCPRCARPICPTCRAFWKLYGLSQDDDGDGVGVFECACRCSTP